MHSLLRALYEQLPHWNAAETHSGLMGYLDFLRHALVADEAAFLATGRHPSGHGLVAQEIFDGWRVFDFVYSPAPDHSSRERASLYLELAAQAGGPDPITSHAIATAGESRTIRRSDVVHDRDWYDHWIKSDFLGRLGFSDRMFAIFHANARAEGYLLISRFKGRPEFTTEDVERLELLMHAGTPLLRWLMIERGLHPEQASPLTPSERRILGHMLSGKTEKAIARSTGTTPGSTHTAIRRMYEKFGVSSRASLMALWLGT